MSRYIKRNIYVENSQRTTLSNQIRNEHWERLNKSGKSYEEIAEIFNTEASVVESELRFLRAMNRADD